MAIQIRQVEPDDFKKLFELFGQRKSQDLLKWVYGHPCNKGLSAYVALEDDKLIGAVGYVKSNYIVGDKTYTGIIPLSWEVQKEHRGMAGVRLLFTALKGADFYLGLDGSMDMRTIFKSLGFKEVGIGRSAFKIINPKIFLKNKASKGPKDYFRAFKSILSKPTSSKIKLTEIENGEVMDNSFAPTNSFHNDISWEHLQWLSTNPYYSVKLFKAEMDNKTIAPIALGFKGQYAQILHIPAIGPQHAQLTSELTKSVEIYLRQQNIASVTMLCTNENNQSIMKQQGFTIRTEVRPIVIKAKPALFDEIKTTTPYLMFSESDKSVRNF